VKKGAKTSYDSQDHTRWKRARKHRTIFKIKQGRKEREQNVSSSTDIQLREESRP